MSSTVYIDTRARQIATLDGIVNMAIADLGAQACMVSCGSADVLASDFDVDGVAGQIQAARYQDEVEIASTGGLEGKLNKAAPDYSAAALGDWKPSLHADPVHIEDGKVDSHSNLRLVSDLECASLDGARMMVFEKLDDLGQKSYVVGLEDTLFDSAGEWKSHQAKTNYETFLSKLMTAQKVALGEDAEPDAAGAKLRGAMRAAGVGAKRSEKLPTGASHTVFTDAEHRETVAQPVRSFRVGGRASS